MKRRPKRSTDTTQLLLFAEAPAAPEETDLDRIVNEIVENIRSTPVPTEAL